MKRLEVFLLSLNGMLVHRRSLPRNFVRFPQQFADTHLYSWVERGTVRVKCFAQEHNTMSPARIVCCQQNSHYPLFIRSSLHYCSMSMRVRIFYSTIKYPFFFLRKKRLITPSLCTLFCIRSYITI